MGRFRRLMTAQATGSAPTGYNTIFSFTTDADVGETLDWSITNPSATIRWIVNTFPVNGNSVNAPAGSYFLNGTPLTVEVQALGASSITADQLKLNYVTGNITVSNTTLGGMDLSNSDTLGNYTFTPAANFNHLNLENTGRSYFDVTTPFNINQNNFYINLSNNALPIEDVARILSDLNTDSAGGATGREVVLDGTNGGIFNSMSTYSIYDGPALKTALEGDGWTVTVRELVLASAYNFTDDTTMTLAGTNVQGVSDIIGSNDLFVPAGKTDPIWNAAGKYIEFGDHKMLAYDTFPTGELEMTLISMFERVSTNLEIVISYRSSNSSNLALATSTTILRNFHHTPTAPRNFVDTPTAGFNKAAIFYDSVNERVGEKLNSGGTYSDDPFTNVTPVTGTHIGIGGQFLGSYSTVGGTAFNSKYSMIFTTKLSNVDLESIFSYIDGDLIP